MVPGWDAVIEVDGSKVGINFDLFCQADAFRKGVEGLMLEQKARRGRVGQLISITVEQEECDEE